jgi:hypothetical protein
MHTPAADHLMSRMVLVSAVMILLASPLASAAPKREEVTRDDYDAFLARYVMWLHVATCEEVAPDIASLYRPQLTRWSRRSMRVAPMWCW